MLSRRLLAALASALTLSVPAAAQSTLDLVSINVPPGSTWEVNKPVFLVFNLAVDLSSVNPNTVLIRDSADIPASGEFFLFDPVTVGFQPDCPVEPDYSDAGLTPGGEPYTIVVPDVASGGPTVLSQGGLTLTTGGSSSFVTPDSDDPAVLFFDFVPGPPNVIVRPSGSTLPDATYLELGGDPSQRVYFELNMQGDSVLPPGFLAPLNLYADLETQVAVVVELDQPISPTEANLAAERVRLEYFEPGRGWRSMAIEAWPTRNCGGSGATLRVEPRGVLPQGRDVRVHLGGGFEDLVGESSGSPQFDFAVFPVDSAVEGGSPLELADERLEEFLLDGGDPASLADETTPLPLPRAAWGGGLLQATGGFEGTGVRAATSTGTCRRTRSSSSTRRWPRSSAGRAACRPRCRP